MWFYVLTIIFLLIDLITKRWMAIYLDLGQTISVIPGWLSWTLIQNEGASFGIFSGYTFVLIGVSNIVIIIIFYLYRKSKSDLFVVQFAFALLISGALGNLIDRILLGHVIDFIEFRWWPAIFNIADMEIRSGIILLIYLNFTKKWEIAVPYSKI